VGQGAVRIEEAGIEVVAIVAVVVVPVPVADSVGGAARMVRERAGKVCAGLAPRQAHLRWNWASLNKQAEPFRVFHRLGDSAGGHRVCWTTERMQVC
jgi:hypothetical protein